jgi:hypothetical protein
MLAYTGTPRDESLDSRACAKAYYLVGGCTVGCNSVTTQTLMLNICFRFGLFLIYELLIDTCFTPEISG